MPPLTKTFSPEIVNVDVTFDVDDIGSPEGPLSTNLTEPLVIQQGLTMIIFVLNTRNAPDEKVAVFQTNPIQWFKTDDDGGSTDNPAPAPNMFLAQRIGDTVATLLDFNSNQSNHPRERQHWFNIVVAYKGQTYGADPTIINQPPASPDRPVVG